MNPIHAVIVYAAAAVLDWIWAFYTREVTRARPPQAAAWATAIILCGVVSVDALINSRWFVIPQALGAATGTYIAVRRHRVQAATGVDSTP